MFENLVNFRGSLFDDLRRLQDAMDDMSGRWPRRTGIRSVARGTYPAINVGSTPERVDVFVFAAGLDADNVEVSLHNNILVVSGERKAPENADANYYRNERFDGAFRRTITLPDDADPEQVDASYRNGVLHIRVQRREASRPRKIAVT